MSKTTDVSQQIVYRTAMKQKGIKTTDLPVRSIPRGELNSFTNLVAVQALDAISLSVTTNTPYHWPRLQKLMTWRNGRLVACANVFWDKVADLNGHQMRVVTFHFPPRIFMEKGDDRAPPVLYGVDIEVSQ
ncbi:hypothetical protein E2C01_032871 [Portunus trituberculatus]|uniref:Uncharacterized protein n=1 Tax=Portunus trituberculatus TaxID=210409 RepID=A0A5B7F2C6_PORTR|nr:hypothetical protein [Portunus trituberculatus]